MRRVRRAVLTAALAGGLVAGGAIAKPLVIGSISGNPGDEVETMLPIARHLARGLGEFGIDDARVIVAQSISQMAELMRSGRVDVYFDSPYPTLAVSQASGAKVLLRRWKRGRSEYRSLILVRADSSVHTLRELAGKTVAFEDNYSTSGYFLPAGALRAAGLALSELHAPGDRPEPGVVGYAFSGSYVNSLFLLLRGRVDAAGVGVHDYERFLKRETIQLRVLHETAPVPRHLVSVRGDLPEAQTRRIREILIGLEHTDEGRDVLRSFENTTRFDDPPRGFEQAFGPLGRGPRKAVTAPGR